MATITNLPADTEVELIKEMEAAMAAGESIETTQGAAFAADVTNVPGAQSMTIAASDQAAWIAAWQISADRDGNEFGTPCKLPKGQLAHYLAKRRADGGRRFSVTIPARIKALPQFRCFIDDCTKRVDERVKLVGHIETYHPYKAQMYAAQIQRLKDAVVRDNPRLRELIDDMIESPERGTVSVPQAILDAQPPEPEMPTEAMNLSGVVEPPQSAQDVIYRCRVEGCKRFFDSTQGLIIHVGKSHKGDA